MAFKIFSKRHVTVVLLDHSPWVGGAFERLPTGEQRGPSYWAIKSITHWVVPKNRVHSAGPEVLEVGSRFRV